MPDDDGAQDYWDGFSIYAEISRDIHESVGQAIDSYSAIVSYHSESAKLRDEEAAQHKAAILSAAHRLLTEMQIEADRGGPRADRYTEILDKWQGDDGWIEQLHKANLSREHPPWLHEFASTIHRGAWHLGYLQAGRREEVEEDTPTTSGREMLEDIANGTREGNA